MSAGLVVAFAALCVAPWSIGSKGTPPAQADLNVPDTQLLRSTQPRRFRIVPEYERKMERVLVSVSDGDSLPKYHAEILSRLPDYTKIDLMAPDSHLDALKAWLKDKPFRHRVRLVGYDPRYRNGVRLYLLLPNEEQLVAVDTEDYRLGSQQGTLWAQDLFEVAATSDNRTLLLTACVHKYFHAERHRRDRRVVSDNAYLACLDADDIEVRRLPLAFKGGNVLMDELDGRRIVFCGYDSVRSSRTAWRAFRGEELSDARVAEMVKSAFDADQVVIVGGARPQPELMYHLDQAMLPLGDGMVGVARVTGECPSLQPDAARVKQVLAFLAKLRPVLHDLGYTVVDIDVTVRNVLNYQHYVNAIPYVDKRTGQRTILTPIFPEATSERDKQVVRKNSRALESLGYTVVHVPTKAYELTGGIHCLVNVLR